MISMSSSTSKWCYDGPIYNDYGCIDYRYVAYTTAPSLEKAVSNIKYRWNKENCFHPDHVIFLDADRIYEGEPPKSLMHNEVSVDGPKFLYKENFDKAVWESLCDIFDLVDAESICLDKYILRTYGIRKEKANGS